MFKISLSKLTSLLLLGILVISAGCKEKQDKIDDDLIQDYLNANNLDAESNINGLYYIIDYEGDGDRPTEFSTVKVIYKGYFLDGEVFDESDEDGAIFDLQTTISGWQQGLQKFRENGYGTLIVPSHLAYGSSGNSSSDPVIPPNTVLAFDIELVKVY